MDREFRQRPRIPAPDATREPPASRLDLRLALDHRPGKLDLPQLVVDPERQIRDPASVHARSFARGRRIHPLPLGPDVSRERTCAPTGEELVRDHLQVPLKRRSSSACASAESPSPFSAELASMVLRICRT